MKGYVYSVVFCLCSLFMWSCTSDVSYKRVEPIAVDGWAIEDTVCFDIPAIDTLNYYQIQCVIRHTERFKNQNVWLFSTWQQDNIRHKDTLNIQLADPYGRWLGESSGSLFVHTSLYKDSVKFQSLDTVHIALIQGMRTPLLKEITDVGLKVVPYPNPKTDE